MVKIRTGFYFILLYFDVFIHYLIWGGWGYELLFKKTSDL